MGNRKQQWNGLRIFELAKQGNAVCVQAIDRHVRRVLEKALPISVM
ncbi:MAG: hypothetical protein ACLTW9_20820 [Enterocloster sp.]